MSAAVSATGTPWGASGGSRRWAGVDVPNGAGRAEPRVVPPSRQQLGHCQRERRPGQRLDLIGMITHCGQRRRVVPSALRAAIFQLTLNSGESSRLSAFFAIDVASQSQ